MPRRTVDDKMPFLEHLGELRDRIVRSLIALIVGLAIAFPFSSTVVDWLARPIKDTGNTLVFLAVTEAFWVQMKVALFLGLFIASLVNVFIASNAFSWLITYAVLGVFIGITAYETQRLRNMAEQNAGNADMSARLAIIGALVLYIAFINIFLSILRILGSRR